MLHVYAITRVEDGSILALYRSIHAVEIELVGHTSVRPHIGDALMQPGDLEAALRETAWVLISYPAHEHIDRQVAGTGLKVARHYLGS